MAIVTRQYEARDFVRLHRLDQECFPPGISYSKWSLHYYLSLPGADCLVAEEGKQIAGFILAEENPPLGHIICSDGEVPAWRGGDGAAAGDGAAFCVSGGAVGAAGNVGGEQERDCVLGAARISYGSRGEEILFGED